MKRPRVYIDETHDELLNEIVQKTGLKKQIAIETLLEKNKEYNFLAKDWIKQLFDSEIGEKLRKELKEKVARSSEREVNHNCMFTCPFFKDPNFIVCMRDWTSKSKLIKVPVEGCNICYLQGYVIPKPKTEAELRAEEERRAQKKRTDMRRATYKTGIQSFRNYPKQRGVHEKFREPFNER